MSRRYNEEHREEINQYMRVYRVANADYIARRQRLRYEENKQLYAENQRWIREERMKREWKLAARKTIKAYLEEVLKDMIDDGRVVVMM